MKTSTTIALLRRCESNGLLKALYKEGLISPKVMLILPVNDKVDALMRSGKSKVEAVKYVADEMHITERTIYRYMLSRNNATK